MKIKLLGVTDEELKQGFNTKEEYSVMEITISGDTYAYDIWYKIKSNKDIVTWQQDLCIEEINENEDKEYEKFLKDIDCFINNHQETMFNFDFSYRFN